MTGSAGARHERRTPLRPLESLERDAAPLTGRPHIEWIAIDGFGRVRDLHLSGLSSGLNVVLGPNEAGKSTVFDFLSAVLFGFPTRKRSDPRYRAAVAGAPHGGCVALCDRSGATYRVERYAIPAKRFALTMSDGSCGDEEDLSRLLGGASAGLFRAVFAVDLDDLRRLDTMSSDEVREVIFSSGILGKSRSVARALKSLDARRDELVRPRQGGRANELSGRLSAVREQLVDARRRTSLYSGLRDELAVRREAIDGLRAEQRQVSERSAEVDTLLRCYDARSQLDELGEAVPELTVAETAHLSEEEVITHLRAELSGHREREGRLSELDRRREGLERSIAERTAQLGEWSLAVATSPAFSAAQLYETLQPSLERRRRALVRLEASRAALLQAREESDKLQTPTATRPCSAPASHGDLQQRLRALRELRTLAAEESDLEREVREGVRLSPRVVSPAAIAIVVAVLAILSGASGLLLLHGSRAAAILLVGFAAVLGLLSAWVATRTGARASSAGHSQQSGPSSRLQAARDARARAASEAGVDPDLPPAALQRLIEETEEAADERRLLDLSVANERAVEARLQALCDEEQDAGAALTLVEQDLADSCQSAGLPVTDPDSLEHVLAELGVLQERITSLNEVRKAHEKLALELESFTSEVASLARRLQADVDAPDRAAAQLADPVGCLEAIHVTLAAVRQRSRERASIEAKVSDLSVEIDRQIGTGARAEVVRVELAAARVAQWRDEQQDLERQCRDLDAQLEEAVREHHKVNLELERLASSSEVAALEQQYFELEAELRETLRRYLAAGAARLVLRRTLKRYEEERQPAVLEAAGAHFARITDGRYVRLGVDSASELPSLRAVRSDGSSAPPEELSRGTAEQLYLCLRLALAESFAEQYVALPIVLDDVLVNFDPLRQAAVARELATAADRHQIVLLTCHPHVAELVTTATGGGATIVEMKTIEASRGVSTG